MKNRALLLLLLLLLIFSVFLMSCKILEITKKIIYKEDGIESRLEAIDIRACKGIEIKESGQREYSAVITAGDDSDNNQIKGIVIFNIEELYGHEILRSSVNFSGAHTNSDPHFGEKVIIEAIDSINFNIEGEYIAEFPVGNYMDFFILNDNFKKTIVNAIDSKRDEFYLRFELENATNNNNREDLVIINIHDAYLKAEFIE